ncbi:hypothetical protein JRQ81_008025 [Phrynocephalus forsythii]|uniref:Protein CUSTOS n=1 Tax=Phrynocephalus forsythii TaxID=171643 RepID=A0A9Q1ATW0_9SAUR|nr:hypothetical protein JRQ81_008025 [Phrynocephalus forsythii]
MAAPRSPSSSSTSSSSEETEETLARLREAAWDPARPSGAALRSPTAERLSQRRQVPASESSTRTKVQDTNELQTTPEFRAHVAKKLEAILDRYSITTLEYPLQTTQNNRKASETENDGFRLFSTSLPGDCEAQEVLAIGKRRPQASSSSELDSDQEWQKFQEAAVTVADILQQSGLPGVLPGCGQELSHQVDGPSGKKSKKKKKKKQKVAEVEEEDSGEEGAVETARSPLSGAHSRGGKVETGGKKKEKEKKKKKPAEARTE